MALESCTIPLEHLCLAPSHAVVWSRDDFALGKGSIIVYKGIRLLNIRRHGDGPVEVFPQGLGVRICMMYVFP